MNLRLKEYSAVFLVNALFLLFVEFGFRFYALQLHQMPEELRGQNFKNADSLMRPSVHPQAGFRYFSNLDVLFLGKKLTTNDSGFRGRKLTNSRDSNTLKIAVIGDSVSAGWGVSDDEVYSAVLEKLLKKSCKKNIEVYNLAIPGQSATQEYFVLKEYIDHGLDFVIINYVGNDWIDESVERKRDYIDSPSYFLNFIVSRVLAKMSGFHHRPELEWRPTKFPRDNEVDGLTEAYSKMAQLLNDREIKTLVLMDSRYESQEQTHEQLEVIFKDFNFLTLNLLKLWHPIEKMSGHEAVRRDDKHNRKYLIPEDFHPNSLWHRDVAGLLSGVLANKLCGVVK